MVLFFYLALASNFLFTLGLHPKQALRDLVYYIYVISEPSLLIESTDSMIVVYRCVRLLQTVSGYNLISKHKILYLYLPSIRGYCQAISVHVSHVLATGKEASLLGELCKK